MVPIELKEFFKQKGRILLIKGDAGTGKTLLGFRLLKEMLEHGEVIWVNSRVMDSADLSKLEEILPKEKRFDTTKSENFKETANLKNNKDINEEQQNDKGYPCFEVIKMLYDEIKEIDNPMVVIDSFEGLTTDLIESEKEHLRTFFIRLARDTNTNMAIIMETPVKNPLDYLADGVITLNVNTFEERRIREMQLSKLRGTEIKQPTYLFTLDEGEFQWLSPSEQKNIKKSTILTPTYDFENKISSGINTLDNILEGGFSKGSVNLFELGKGVETFYQRILIPTIINHINQKRGFIYIPMEGDNSDNSIELLSPLLKEDYSSKYIRSLEKSINDFDSKSFIIPCEGKSLKDDILPIMLARRNFKVENKVVLSLIGLDTIEFRYGLEEAHNVLSDFVSETKRNNHVDLLIAKQDQKIIGQIEHMAETHWKIQIINGSLLFYGIVPRTVIYYVSLDTSLGFLQTKLIPIL